MNIKTFTHLSLIILVLNSFFSSKCMDDSNAKFARIIAKATKTQEKFDAIIKELPDCCQPHLVWFNVEIKGISVLFRIAAPNMPKNEQDFYLVTTDAKIRLINNALDHLKKANDDGLSKDEIMAKTQEEFDKLSKFLKVNLELSSKIN